MNENNPTNKRKVYFIEKKFQSCFILKFCSLVAFGGLLTIGLLYLFSLRSTTVSIVDSRVVVHSTADFILPVLIQTVVIVMILVGLATIAVTLFFSHKIAGPLYHFKKAMQALEGGDFSQDFRIRQLDQLQDVADAFNAMIIRVRGQLGLLKENLSRLKEKLDDISGAEVAEHKRQALAELKRITEELHKVIDYFKS